MVEPRLLGVPLHPTQLYEAIGNLLIFTGLLRVVLPRLESGRLHSGALAAAYFGSYAALRFGLEFLRGDTVPTPFLGLTAGQELCLALFSAALVFGWPRRAACIPS
jgi:phosphatidylglycerol:prolipoprotein diacylglycerol transferase